MTPPADNGSDQSEPMGRSDGEEEVPMKGPATEGADEPNEADESFLDDDFLSFDNVDNGGGGLNGDGAATSNGGDGKLSGRKRDRSPMNDTCPPAPNKTPAIPWLNDAIAPQKPPPPPPPPPQQQQWGRDRRGYNGNAPNRNQYYTPPPPRAPPLIRLHNEIVSFVKLMSPTKEELDVRDRMVERVTKLAHRIFGGEKKCDVLPFGSQVTGLCLPGSDIDFVIRFKEGKSEEEEDDDDDDFASTSNPLHRFADAVRDEFGVRSEEEAGNEAREEDDDESEHLSYLEVIEQTRVPLVKFTVAPYNIDIDVCFDQPHGPESAELMHRFMESMPPLRPLTFVLKHFLASREINKPFTGGIGSYLLQLMIVSYLQQRAREDVARQCGAGGKHFNLGSLLLDFFELYGIDFNYVTTGISVRHDGHYFPKGGDAYKNSFWQPSKQFSLAVENPFEPTHDVGGGTFRIQMIQRIFAHAFKTLLAYVSEPLEPTDSILATIIPPTEEMEKRIALKSDINADTDEGGGVASGGDKLSKNQRKALKRRQKNEKSVRKQQRREEKKEQRRKSGGGGGKSKNKKRKERRHSS